MVMDVIDLHVHSDRSDGSDTPARIVEFAAEAGCTAIALTDHDRVDGIAPARAAGARVGVDVVGGCETSCRTETGALHLLAYFVDDAEGPFQSALGELQETRRERNLALAERFADLGLPVTLEEMQREAGVGGVGRPHAAAVLARKGVVTSVQEAFDRWLARGRPAYVERRRLTAADAITLVRASGGVPVLAHPLTLESDLEELRRRVADLAVVGLGGLEAYYGRYPPATRDALARLAHDLGLVATGGSDYHGRYKPDLQIGTGRGDLEVPTTAIEALETERARWRAQ
jgi:predicted metal-dependent phosphoesterase TrpH